MLDFDCNLLETTLASYRQGYTKPTEITSEISGDSFNHNLQTLIESRFPLTDQLLMHRARNARYQALSATRRGQFITAERLFTEAHATIQLNKLSTEGMLLYKSFLIQAETYLDYCRGDFVRVYTRTFEALEIDVILEEEYGYKILLLHRIQLLHNLVRTDAQRMYFEQAVDLASHLLSYLKGTVEVLPIQSLWGSKRVACLPSELVAAMFAQITGEIALILAGKNSEVALDLFAIAARNLKLQASDDCICHLQAYAWLLLKQAFVDNNITSFLEQSSNFLAKGRTDIPLLWYATVIDLIALCDKLNIPNSKLLRQEIARDTVTWQYLPKKFSLLLCSRPDKSEFA
jgi:hypothetical protein